ncbi:hypothetical protein GDO81_001850 [Engystomops pustulosus]|uniref:Uncharacterized protein n=1 Tax=Engystomops pustulosus TaxID=76066 RepID=A0AAV7DFP2_ENGPU|nr:hypothetical protein GDO81_001848 [Engystomops pustulosus]KAG8596324.1 hypothetical protein GDO81_001850 [Engystomops pustulosus]
MKSFQMYIGIGEGLGSCPLDLHSVFEASGVLYDVTEDLYSLDFCGKYINIFFTYCCVVWLLMAFIQCS